MPKIFEILIWTSLSGNNLNTIQEYSNLRQYELQAKALLKISASDENNIVESRKKVQNYASNLGPINQHLRELSKFYYIISFILLYLLEYH